MLNLNAFYTDVITHIYSFSIIFIIAVLVLETLNDDTTLWKMMLR